MLYNIHFFKVRQFSEITVRENVESKVVEHSNNDHETLSNKHVC